MKESILQRFFLINKFKPSPTKKKSYDLPEIIRGWKTFSARRINQLRNSVGQHVWQRSFHDHIIRNQHELENIRAYTTHNPLLAEKFPSEVLTWQKN